MNKIINQIKLITVNALDDVNSNTKKIICRVKVTNDCLIFIPKIYSIMFKILKQIETTNNAIQKVFKVRHPINQNKAHIRIVLTLISNIVLFSKVTFVLFVLKNIDLFLIKLPFNIKLNSKLCKGK